MNIDYHRYIIADSGKRIDISNCYWCGSREHLCSICADKARDIWQHEYQDSRIGETHYTCGDMLGELFGSIFQDKRAEFLAAYRAANLRAQS